MDKLVIAPTATYKRQGTRKEVNDTLKDYKDFVVLEQKLDPMIPEGANKGSPAVEQKTYFDMQQIHYLHERNRAKDLQIFDEDVLYTTRPMYNISLPEMKLRRHTV